MTDQTTTTTTTTTAEDETDKIEVTTLLVIIDRDAHTKLPASIFEWELPILHELYTEEQVYEEDSDLVEVDAFTANEAFEALRRKYAQNIDAVLKVYPSVRAFAKASGLAFDADSDTGKLKQSAVTDHAKGKKSPAKKTAGKKTAAAK